MRKLCFVLVASLLVSAVPAQTRAQLKRDLKAKEAQADNADALVQVAKWAKEKGLLTDHKRLLTKVLKKDKNHEAANIAAGNVRYKGDWMSKAKAQLLHTKEMDAAFKAKGMKKVDGVWVTKAEVDDAKKGIFQHDGQPVTRADKLALMAGKVRHPVTGEFIPAADMDKANNGQFLLPNGRWVDAKEANEYHADAKRPWVLRTHYTTILTNDPVEKFRDLKGQIDGSIDVVKPFFGGQMPHPKFRPVIITCPTTGDFKEIGNAVGGNHSIYGAFVAEQIPEYEDFEFTFPPTVANWGEKKGWGPYHLKHAAGIAYATSMVRQAEAEVPYWLVCGVGSLVERHGSPGDAAHFGRQHIAKGGVEDVKTWFDDFEISSNIPQARLDYNVFQAGLVLSFCMRGGDAELTKAAQELTKAFGDKNGKAIAKAAKKIQRVVTAKEEGLRGYLQQVLQKG